MAGILDNKERVMDFTVTQEGKRQAGTGEMRIRFASFTDLHANYTTSGSLLNPSLADDASSKIYFETYNRYQDVIVPELEAGYSLRPFRTSDFEIMGGTIASGTFTEGMSDRPNVLSGSDIGPAMEAMLEGITTNFTDQRIIGTTDEFSLYQEVVISPVTGTFTATENFKDFFRADSTGKVFLDEIPSIFNDRRFSHFPNFKYLPPVNKPIPGTDIGNKIGNYPKLNEKEIITLDGILASLKGKQHREFTFSKTSRSNNLVVQFFEQDVSGIDKLSIIDFGEFIDDDPLSPGIRVFFIGKILRDKFGAETFCNVFTVVMD